MDTDSDVLVLATSRGDADMEGSFTAESVAANLAAFGVDEWMDIHHNGSHVDNAALLDRALAESGVVCRREETRTPEGISRVGGEPAVHRVVVRYYGAGQGTA